MCTLLLIILIYFISNKFGSGYRDKDDGEVVLRCPHDEEGLPALPPGHKSRSLDMRDLIHENSQFSIMNDLCYNSKKTYGGWHGDISEVPFQVSLRVKHSRMLYSSNCTGSLITLKHVITAAACFVNSSYPLSDWRIVAGSNKDSGSEGDTHLETWRRIRCFYASDLKHLVEHDIAVIEAERPFEVTAKVQPIRIHTDMVFRFEPESLCLMTGYWDSQDPESSNVLRIACIPILSFRQCSKYYPSHDIPPNTVCAGDVRGTDTCFVSAGSSLVCRGVLVGVLSQGFNCSKQPGIFMKILGYTKIQGAAPMKRTSSSDNIENYVQNGSVRKERSCLGILVVVCFVNIL